MGLFNKNDKFLIEEYRHFWSNIKHNIEKRQRYQNFFIALFSALIGSVAAFIKWQNSYRCRLIEGGIDTFDLLIPILILTIAIFGQILFKIEIKIRKEIIEGFWQINDIRRYFIKKYKNLREYLHYEVKSEPGFLKRTNESMNSIRIITLLDSILFSLFIFFIFDIGILKNTLIESDWVFLNMLKYESDSYIIFQSILGSLVFIISQISFRICTIKTLSKHQDKYKKKVLKRQKNEYINGSLKTFFNKEDYKMLDDKYEWAKKRIQTIKNFYIHLYIYIFFNIVFIIINIVAMLIFGYRFYTFLIPLIGWGIGIFWHAISLFVFNGKLGKRWKEKKITEIMKQIEENK